MRFLRFRACSYEVVRLPGTPDLAPRDRSADPCLHDADAER